MCLSHPPSHLHLAVPTEVNYFISFSLATKIDCDKKLYVGHHFNPFLYFNEAIVYSFFFQHFIAKYYVRSFLFYKTRWIN